MTFIRHVFVVFALILSIRFASAQSLPNTQPLDADANRSASMVAGIDRYLTRATDESIAGRVTRWHRDLSSVPAYEKSIAPNRESLRKIIGAVDTRVTFSSLDYVSDTTNPAKIAETDSYEIFAVRWPVLEGVHAEGLWVKPHGTVLANVVLVPDADQTPEILCGFGSASNPAGSLAELGCEILIPTLINREDTFSGSTKVGRFTNQPHREWIYRQSFELGHHIIGYEIEKVLAAVDWFAKLSNKPIGVAGYGEGGLIAFYSAALDSRINATLVSGYFESRQKLWQEPIYRNAFGLLKEFGDAELATLIAPRALIIEHSAPPNVQGPPAPHDNRHGAAPGKITPIEYESVENEAERARILLNGKFADSIALISGNEGMTTGPLGEKALAKFLHALGRKEEELPPSNKPVPADSRTSFSASARQQGQIDELTAYTQTLMRDSARVRDVSFWSKATTTNAADWAKQTPELRNQLWNVLGRLPSPTMPLNPRTRQIGESPKWIEYEVVLDVYPDVFAWGYLLVPRDIKAGERRPVVVCQHGLEGTPESTVSRDPNHPDYHFYKGFSTQLADRGFVVFAPHNPYRGENRFRELQRKANPLGVSLFSFIIAQHGRILDWLSEQPFVDSKRLGFYGLSYGGKTAMRVPPSLDRYCLSICSGDFNEWIRKVCTVDSPYSYMFTQEYEMLEWNLGNTFSYAEMAALIAPRPFMVERGHGDGVAPDEWVAEEYAKVRRFYDKLGIGNDTEIEFFNGPHTIHGIGTFEFLQKHLQH
ncbi:MAG: alpha/beta hydrolase family protein [Limisphaerales bacterium]